MSGTLNGKSLDLGCNNRPHNPYNFEHLYGIDITPQIVEGVTCIQANLALEAIPFEDNYFDCVTAYDFIEHIPRQLFSLDTGKSRLPFIELMNEIWRVLKPDGIFYAVTPVYPSATVFQDPTHVNFITKDTHQYFCGGEPLANMYGFTGRFEKLRADRVTRRTALTADQSMAKRLYNFKKSITAPHLLSHILWELQAKK